MGRLTLPAHTLVVFFLLLGCCLARAQAENSILFVHVKASCQVSVWRVASNGTAESLPFQFGEACSFSLGIGGTEPLPSPDQRWIAFARDNNLWLLDVPLMEATQITHVGKPYNQRYASVDVFITAWSPDSRRVLYHVTPGMTDCIDCQRPDWEMRPADYGFYVYDLEEKSTRPIELPGSFHAWLPDGDFLLSSNERGSVGKQLLRFDWEEGTVEPITDRRGWYGQFDSSFDGRWLLTHVHDWRKGQILKLNVQDGGIFPVTPWGSMAEYQWPQFSPSGADISYVWQEGLDDSGTPRQTLVVNNRPIYRCDGGVDFHWIDNGTIALACQDKLIVVDTETGDEKGRVQLD